MSDLEEQINNIGEENAQVEQPQAEQETLPPAGEAAVEAPQDTQTPQDLWKQTKQFEQGLWKTPDDIYNSVKYYEQKFQPLEQSLKRMGFKEPQELEQAFKDYQTNLPNYKANEETINLLNALLQDETYGSKLRATFDEIRRAQEMQKFGFAYDDLPEVVREKVSKGEQAFQELEEMKQQKAYETSLNTINEEVGKIEKLAQEYGFEVNIPELLEHCRDNNINPSNIYGEFLKSNFSQLVDKAKQNASLATTMQNKQNKAKAVNTSTKQGGEVPPQKVNDLEKAILEKL